MAKIIDFPVKKTININTCGQCKIFDSCYAESLKIFAPLTDNPEKEKEAAKKIPACDKISL